MSTPSTTQWEEDGVNAKTAQSLTPRNNELWAYSPDCKVSQLRVKLLCSLASVAVCYTQPSIPINNSQLLWRPSLCTGGCVALHSSDVWQSRCLPRRWRRTDLSQLFLWGTSPLIGALPTHTLKTCSLSWPVMEECCSPSCYWGIPLTVRNGNNE